MALPKEKHLNVTPWMVPGCTLLALQGILDETFDAMKLGGSWGGGALVIDLDGVQRITSFGVREWIRALKGKQRQYLGFVRARPSVVSQFNMVHNFAGDGELISFYAPYRCAACGQPFEFLVDLRVSHEQIRRFVAPAAVCPQCQGEGRFDDDPAWYFAFAASASRPNPPAIVEQLIARGDAPAGPAFRAEKVVRGTTTAIRLSGALNGAAHLKWIADGLDGTVLLLFDGITDATPEGIDRLVPLLGNQDISFLLARVPIGIGAVLAERGSLGAAKVLSFRVKLECGRCKASNYFDLDAASLEAHIGGTAEPVSCEECGDRLTQALDEEECRAALKLPCSRPPPEIESFLGGALAQTLTTPTHADKAQGSMQFGRYQLSSLIGTGGMAEVFLAKQIGVAGFSKTVAVKRILPHFASEKSFVEMFLQEARVASRISHPNVVQIFDLGEVSGSYYIAMEYVRGWDLNLLLRRAVELNSSMPLGLAAYVVARICAGLHAAHSCVDDEGAPTPIIHRDVSPHNVLVSVDGQVKLADFGIAKAIDGNRTPTATMKGKLAYLSPEQISGTGQVDARADIFPAGIILFQLVTGAHPFQAENEIKTMMGALGGADLPRAAALRSGVPAQIDEIIGRALARDVAQRYQTALAMQQELERFMVGQERASTAAELAAWLESLALLCEAAGKPLPVRSVTPSGGGDTMVMQSGTPRPS